LACHLGPTLAVTAAVAGLSMAAGRSPIGVLWTAAAVLTGQLSVGWCNDARDAGRDLAAGRLAKPTVRGWVTARQLAIGAGVAVTACVPLSYVAFGPIGGSLHLVAVASAWAYDLWLKTTLFSAAPYVLSFGLIPALVTFGLTPSVAPTWWATTAAALVGFGAHLANAAPDVEGDQLVAAGGLVAAIGERRARAGAVIALLLASALLIAQLNVLSGIQVLAFAALTAIAVAGALRDAGRHLFNVVLVIALIDVVLLLVSAKSFAS
jgi:4-hydroxybenzoate polyprenyltransferase